jgi:hypothetical protein
LITKPAGEDRRAFLYDSRNFTDSMGVMQLPGTEIEKAAANVLEKAASNIVDGGTSFGSNVFNGFLGDKVREWRNRNLIKAASETARIMKEAGASLEAAKALPMLEFYSIFQGASEQDDPDVTKLWAGLLASRMAAESEEDFDKQIVQTLQGLNGTEAKILHFLKTANELWHEINKQMPPYDHVRARNDQKIYIEELGKIKVKILEEFKEKLFELHDNLFSGRSMQAIALSIKSLDLKGLIFAHDDIREQSQIIRSERVSDSFNGSKSVDVIDGNRLSEVLSGLRSRAIGASGKSRRLPSLFEDTYDGPRLLYSITDPGEYLLERCTLQKKSEI